MPKVAWFLLFWVPLNLDSEKAGGWHITRPFFTADFNLKSNSRSLNASWRRLRLSLTKYHPTDKSMIQHFPDLGYVEINPIPMNYPERYKTSNRQKHHPTLPQTRIYVGITPHPCALPRAVHNIGTLYLILIHPRTSDLYLKCWLSLETNRLCATILGLQETLILLEGPLPLHRSARWLDIEICLKLVVTCRSSVGPFGQIAFGRDRRPRAQPKAG